MIVVITGASAGIGRELAKQLSAARAKLALAARRIERLQELNQSLGGGHLVIAADVSSPADCHRIISTTLERFGRIDTVICNAGYGLYREASEFTPDETRRMFATNVFGTTDLIHAAAPVMLEQELRDRWRGQIMIVSSAAARRSPPFLGIYGATKAAQLSIAEAARVELRSRRIAVTSVHPIMTKTEFGQVAEASSEMKLPRDRTFHQTVDHVARKMIRAIERPGPEVWPHWPTRVAVWLGALFPGVADRALKGYYERVRDANRQQNPALRVPEKISGD